MSSSPFPRSLGADDDAALSPPPRGFEVLVVDHEPPNSSQIADALADAGVSALRAESGARALVLAKVRRPELLIIDLDLPDLPDLRRFERAENEIPADVILIGGQRSPHGAEAIRSSTVGHFTRPVDLDLLMNLVRSVARRRELAAENRSLQGKLLRAKGQWEKTFDAIADPLLITSSDGTIVRANRALFDKLQRAPQQVIGQNADALVFRNAERREPTGVVNLAAVRASLENLDFGPDTLEVTGLAFPGVYALQEYAVELEDDTATVLFLRDTTEIHQANEVRRRLAHQIAANQRLDSIGRLAGGVAHDFNNMLTVVMGSLDLACMDLPEDSPALEFIGHARRGANKATEITRRLLAFSGRQPSQAGPLDLRELLNDFKNLLRRTLGEDVQLHCHVEEGLFDVQMESAETSQLLLNLAVNAREAMPDGGSLTIVAKNVHLDKAACATLPELEAGDHVLLDFKDTGTGMSAEILRHALEPFYTTKQRGPGAGLGLATVYGSVIRGGGCIRIDSGEAGGTSVSIYLKRSRAKEYAETSSPESDVLAGNESILLVEDEADIRQVVVPGLRALGYQVDDVDNGGDAVQRLQDPRLPAIDLVISDIVMPGINGFQLAEQIRGFAPDLPILLVSGYPKDQIALRAGFVSEWQWLPKPFTPSQLAREVRKLLDRAAEQS